MAFVLPNSKINLSIDELDINPRIIGNLRKANLTKAETILSLSLPDIERLTDLSPSDAHNVKNIIAESVLQKSQLCRAHLALELYQRSCAKDCAYVKLTTGCPTLDRFFKGGIISRGITEFCGVSASGKTQLCLQLCLTVQLSSELGGLNAGAVYICTEDVFPNKRLYQMIDSFTRRYERKTSSAIPFGDKIFIEHIPDVESLQSCVQHRLPSLLSRGGVRLVIIDSVAALFRCEYSSGELHERSKQLSSFAARLLALGDRYNIPVVCVNQVTASMKDSSKTTVPALGLTWANQVTTRVLFTRRDVYARSETSRDPVTVAAAAAATRTADDVTCNVVRSLEVAYAPHLPTWVCRFKIDQNGVSGIL